MSKNNSFQFLCMAILSITLFSCNKKSDNPQPDTGTANQGNDNLVTFLKLGSVSKYQYIDFFNNDTIKTVVEEEVAKDTFLIRNYTSISSVSPRQFMALSNNVLSVSSRLRDKNYYQVICKFGQPVGTSWPVYKNGVFSYTASIDSLNARVVTESGIYTDAVKVKIVAGTSTSYQYYSPAAGILGLKNSSFNLKSHITGSVLSVAPARVADITYGNFSFMGIGKYWSYYISDFSGDSDSIRVTILSKDAKNVYKVKIRVQSATSDIYEYWFEDNGYLMVYMEGETVLNADPVYVKPGNAKVGHGWTGYSGTTAFIYRINSLSTTATSTKFGSLPCMAISVSSGLFSQQTNNWNADKGEVSVSGLLNQDLIYSNARSTETARPIAPGFID